jgi:NAD(P) transhydrogenase subunit alpha
MSDKNLTDRLTDIANQAQSLADQSADALAQAASTDIITATQSSDPFLITGLTVLLLAAFVGYYVVWGVTPALHSPLMSVSNAISSVVIVGAILALGAPEAGFLAKLFGFVGVVFASINIFGGFIVTHKMLNMFRK